MRILHIISSLSIGGAQRLLSDLLPLLAKENDITLLVNEYIDNEFTRIINTAGITIIKTTFNLQSYKNIIYISKISRNFDVVHVHLFPSVYWAAFAKLLSPIKLVYTEHSTSNRRRGKWYLKPIEKFVYGRYDTIISISKQTQDALLTWLNIKGNSSKFVVINNGVNLSRFNNLEFQKIYPYTLIMISRFAASKDQKTVIKAMKYLPRDVHVLLVGGGENLEACRKLTNELDLSDRVHFVGQQTNIIPWIAKSDIGIQSSNWEGFGLTAVELMASGRPVVASNVDGLRQVVEGAGELFPVGDEIKLAEILKKLLYDSNYYRIISEKCKKRAGIYNVDCMSLKYENVYKNLLNKSVK